MFYNKFKKGVFSKTDGVFVFVKLIENAASQRKPINN